MSLARRSSKALSASGFPARNCLPVDILQRRLTSSALTGSGGVLFWTMAQNSAS